MQSAHVILIQARGKQQTPLLSQLPQSVSNLARRCAIKRKVHINALMRALIIREICSLDQTRELQK